MRKFIILVLAVIISWFFVYGQITIFWTVPEKEAEIKHLQSKMVMLETQVDSLHAAVEQYRIAMRFENLFFLTADQNDLLDFSMLEELLCEKRGLCQEVTE